MFVYNRLRLHQGNIKDEMVGEIVGEFLRLQMGAGEDHTTAARHELYEIDLDLDLRSDSFRCRHNCGNLGLRDGILLRFVQKLGSV